MSSHEKKESKFEEKKEHMARKLFVAGKGSKKEIMEKLGRKASQEERIKLNYPKGFPHK